MSGFYSLEEAKEKLNKTEEEIKQFVQEGKLREFHDGPNLLFKVEEVDGLISGESVEVPLEAPEIEMPEEALELETPEDEIPELEMPEGEALEAELPEMEELPTEGMEAESLEPELPDMEELPDIEELGGEIPEAGELEELGKMRLVFREERIRRLNLRELDHPIPPDSSSGSARRSLPRFESPRPQQRASW